MKYLISGSHGFIGTALTDRLQKEGHEVVGIRRELLSNVFRLTRFFKTERPDFIIHLAAYGNHYSQTNDRQTIETNILGTFNMLTASRWIDYQRFYNISTSSVTLPVDTFYSASKMAGEKIVNAFRLKYNKPIVNVRPYSVYGPGEADHRFIPQVIKHLKSGKEMRLDEEAVHDWVFVDCFITALLNGETEIGTGKQTINYHVVRILERISGKKLNYVPDKLRVYDTNKKWYAKKGVPHISLETGLKLTYESFA